MRIKMSGYIYTQDQSRYAALKMERLVSSSCGNSWIPQRPVSKVKFKNLLVKRMGEDTNFNAGTACANRSLFALNPTSNWISFRRPKITAKKWTLINYISLHSGRLCSFLLCSCPTYIHSNFKQFPEIIIKELQTHVLVTYYIDTYLNSVFSFTFFHKYAKYWIKYNVD